MKRMKKPFNSILGETYEYVGDRFRFFGEQVSHHPPVSAYHFEGKNYTTHGSTSVKQSFKVAGGGVIMQFE